MLSQIARKGQSRDTRAKIVPDSKGEHMHTFADPIKAAVRMAANKVGVIDGDASFTFRALHDRCAKLAGALRELGLNKGDRVAILAGNGTISPTTEWSWVSSSIRPSRRR